MPEALPIGLRGCGIKICLQSGGSEPYGNTELWMPTPTHDVNLSTLKEEKKIWTTKLRNDFSNQFEARTYKAHICIYSSSVKKKKTNKDTPCMFRNNFASPIIFSANTIW